MEKEYDENCPDCGKWGGHTIIDQCKGKFAKYEDNEGTIINELTERN